MELYFECTRKPPRISDENGNEYTTEQARELYESGKVDDCNRAFMSLVRCNYDIAATLAKIDAS